MERNVHRLEETKERKVEKRRQPHIVAALDRAAEELRVLEELQEPRKQR